MGKFWNLRYVPQLSLRGYCDSPENKNKEIVIWQGLKGQELLEVLVHEMLHACAYKALSEEFVTEAADDISRAIWKELKAKGYLQE